MLFEPNRNSSNIGFHIDYMSFYCTLYAAACPDEGRVVNFFQTETLSKNKKPSRLRRNGLKDKVC